MKRFLTLVLIVFLTLGTMFVTGCGGGGQKVNGVGNDDANSEAANAKAEEKATTYEVMAGDTLWSIASKAEVYGEKNQWPLIYDANRDILSGYDGAEAGQTLIIPRNVSAEDIETAKERAMELGFPPKEKNADENITGMEIKAAKGLKANKKTGAIAEALTPIAEPGKTDKKAEKKMIAIAAILLLAGVGTGMFLSFKKNKRKDDEAPKDANNKV